MRQLCDQYGSIYRMSVGAAPLKPEKLAVELGKAHGLLAACWHLADACPLGPYDRLALLRSTRARQLLSAVDDAYDQAVQMHEAFGPGS